jgi:hypothetical protein
MQQLIGAIIIIVALTAAGLFVSHIMSFRITVADAVEDGGNVGVEIRGEEQIMIDDGVAQFTQIGIDLGLAAMEYTPHYQPPQPVENAVSSENSTLRFSLTYGLMTITNGITSPWVEEGKINPTSTDALNYLINSASFHIFVDNGTQLNFTISCGGNMIRYITPNIAGGSTNYSVSTMPKTNTIVIERSTNLLVWEPIYTNTTITADTVNFFTDTHAPSNAAFYRSRR